MGETISRRNAARAPWAWDQILERAEEQGGADLQLAQKELLDILVSMQDVEPRFDSVGDVDATYKVHLARRQTRFILQIYADGRLYISWEGFFRENQLQDVDAMRRVWGPYVKGPLNRVGSYTSAALGAFAPLKVASLLQETADVTQPI